MIPIYKPYLKKYKSSALNAINDEWISNHGIYIDLASEKLKNILGIKYCILMNNGTSATHCLFKSLKFKYPEIKKIYIPNNVFIAPYNCGLIEYPADMFEVMKLDKDTLNIDTSIEYINSLETDSVVVIVHNLGNIVNVPRLHSLRPDLIFIEDNCEGLFGVYDGIYSGSCKGTLCSSISFYGNKTVTTGEGGAFLTNDLELYKFIKTYYSHGMTEQRYIHSIVGTNYRMTNIQAGFLYDQLNDIDNIISLKKNVFKKYLELFDDFIKKGIAIIPKKEENTELSYWMFVILIPNIKYTDLEKYLLEKRVQIRPLFYDIHKHDYLTSLKKHEHDLFTSKLTEYGIMLPSYPELTNDEQIYIYNVIKEYCELNLG